MVFKSDVVPHEVLPTTSRRLAIVGWLHRHVEPAAAIEDAELTPLARAIRDHFEAKGQVVKLGSAPGSAAVKGDEMRTEQSQLQQLQQLQQQQRFGTQQQPFGTAHATARRRATAAFAAQRARPLLATSSDAAPSDAAVAKERTRLNAIFAACAEGRPLSADDEAAIRKAGGPQSARYGEITPLGFAALAERLGLCEADVFADLGSGVGRACLQAVLEYRVRAACGVELSRTRHESAVRQQEEAAKQRGHEADGYARVHLACADCCDPTLWSPGGVLHEVSVIWICSELFDDGLMARIGHRLEAARSVRLVATLRRFPGGDLTGFRLQERPEVCEMSWTAALSNPNTIGSRSASQAGGPGARVYIYERLRDAAMR